jgi:ribosomal protein S18 acetylase RimI-like enzyme
MHVLIPSSSFDFERYFALRFDVLRKPWNQPPGSEKDELEETSQHAMIVDDLQEIVGVCRMQYNTPEEAQLRYMAIRADMQGRGLGQLLLDHFEQIARKDARKYITLHAREQAISFYKRNGYEVKEKSYLMWGIIQHYRMEKML